MPSADSKCLKQNTPILLKPRKIHRLSAIGLPSDETLHVTIRYLDKQKFIAVNNAFNVNESHSYTTDGIVKRERIINSSLFNWLDVPKNQPIEITVSWKPEIVDLTLTSYDER